MPQTPQGRQGTTLPLWTIIIIVVIAAIIVATLAAQIIPAGSNAVGETVLREYFLDIDGDGDLDYVKEARVVLNCSGQACATESPE